MSIYKRGRIYWYKFMWNGEMIRESTKQGSDKKARNIESAHRTRLSEHQKEADAARMRLDCTEVLTCHECEKLFNADKVVKRDRCVFCSFKCATTWGKARTMPMLKEFLENRFLPDAETRHKAKPATYRYYKQSCAMIKRSTLATLRLDELTEEHAQVYAAEFRHLSPSGINRGLRTLRRAMNLAFKWNIIDKPVKVELAKGEVQRDRVLSAIELDAYLSKCQQPWRDCATILADEGMRPGEVFSLQWQHVLLSDDESESGMIQVVDGKSKAARRILPMTPAVYRILKARCIAAKMPSAGWIFPSGSKDGHLTVDGLAKAQHKKALEDSGVAPFPPYTLRHTALTRLGEASGGDVFALARIAGHSSISITQRYVHPQAETIYRVFAKALTLQKRSQLEAEKGEEVTAELASSSTN
jgi:integrase